MFKNWLFKTSTEKTQRNPLHETNITPAKKTDYSSIQGNAVPFLDALFSRIHPMSSCTHHLPTKKTIYHLQPHPKFSHRSEFTHENQQKRGKKNNIPINHNPWPIHGFPPSILTPKPNLTHNPNPPTKPNPNMGWYYGFKKKMFQKMILHLFDEFQNNVYIYIYI